MRAHHVAPVLLLLSALAAAGVAATDRDGSRHAPPSVVPIPLQAAIDGYTPPSSPAGAVPARLHGAAAATPVCGGGVGTANSSVKTFGWVNAGGLAVEDEVWTFDHDGDPWEGWTRHDLSTDPFAAFRHVDNSAWSGHDNTVAPPLIEGSGSVWLGFHEDEADSACWDAGLGYGNNWGQRITSPAFENSVGTSVTISFDYWYDCESSYDEVKLILDNGVTRTTLTTFSGQGGTYQSPLHFSQAYLVTGQFNLLFEFTSDSQNSDEDDNYGTSWGAFGFDEFNITGLEDWVGTGPPYEFESSLEGWVASAIPGAGEFADINSWGDYGLGGCGQSGNVATFHNNLFKHAAGQYERIVSPPVDISSYDTAPLNVWAEYDLYADLPVGDNVFFKWTFQYYPEICPVTGDSIWSDHDGPGPFATTGPVCLRIRSYANDLNGPSAYASGTTLVPAGADSIRLAFEVVSASASVSGNESPMFDNIVIGVSDASTILHVPSPQYPDIVSATAAVSPGDTIVVRPGTYTGQFNKDVTLDGIAATLVSEDGSAATVIDCEGVGRGFLFNNNETRSTVVDGFTVTRGQPDLVGNSIYVYNTASPTIRDVVVRDTRVIGSAYGAVRIDTGNPLFECFVAENDTTTASGGLIIVNGGAPEFDAAIIQENTTQFSCVSLVGGSPKLEDVYVSQNVTTNAVIVETDATFDNCVISQNSDVGMYFYSASPSALDSCTIALNGAGGVVLEDNSSSFTDCDIILNEGAGVAIINVTAALAASPTPRAQADAAASAVTTTFVGCTISGNVNTSSSGGGVRFDCDNVPTGTFAPYYQDCVITGNASLFSGGGIAVCGIALLTDIAPVFANCTISRNSAGDNGGGIYMDVDGSGSEIYQGMVSMQRSIVWGNCASGMGEDGYAEPDNVISFDCSDIDSTGIDGSGVVIYENEQVFEDPEFCSPPGCSPSGTADGEFTIALNSPANPVNSPCGQLIGAGDPLCSPPTGIGDDAGVPARTALHANVPNPFNPTTTVRFDVSRATRVSLDIFDVRGRLVHTLVRERLDAGTHQRRWNGTDDRGRPVAAGVYFARLIVGAEVETRKLVLVK